MYKVKSFLREIPHFFYNLIFVREKDITWLMYHDNLDWFMQDQDYDYYAYKWYTVKIKRGDK